MKQVHRAPLTPDDQWCARSAGGSAKGARYVIRPMAGSGFYVGCAENGRQFIIGSTTNDAVAYLFDPEGKLMGREKRPLQPGAQVAAQAMYWLCDPPLRRRSERTLEKWKADLGFVESPIEVYAFFDQEYHVGIEEVPRCLDEPAENETETEKRERLGDRDLWMKSDRFVFWWELDYWIDKVGACKTSNGFG